MNNVIFITRVKGTKDLDRDKLLKRLIENVYEYGITNIYVINSDKDTKGKIGKISVEFVYNNKPTGPISINTVLRKIKNKPKAFLVCSKEVGLEIDNIETLVREIRTENLLVVGYKFMIKNRKLNDELQDFYENDQLIAYKVPWNTCAIWNYKLFADSVGKFDEITVRNPSGQLGVTVDGEGFQTDHRGMEDGLAIAEASSKKKRKRIYFKLLDDYLFWKVESDYDKRLDHRKKLARKDTVMRNFMGVKNYSVEDLEKSEMKS